MGVAAPVLSRDDAAARSGTYRLLARLWLREVDRDLVRELRSPPVGDYFIAAGGILPAGEDESTIERLAIDYCRLFVGPTGHLPPYQSVWQTGQLQGTTAASMKQFAAAAGYDRTGLASGTMLDHLGVQLDVMGHILGHIATWPPNSEDLDQAWELANSFLHAHLLWPADLFDAAQSGAETEFYQSAIELTRALLASEASG